MPNLKKRVEIPDWTGAQLTMGAFVKFVTSINQSITTCTVEKLKLDAGTAATFAERVKRLAEFVNLSQAFEETPRMQKADNTRDALWKAIYYAHHYLMQLPPDELLYESALQLRPVMAAYKGIDRHELTKETTEIDGFLRDVTSKAENQQALSDLGLASLVNKLLDANNKMKTEMSAREGVRGERLTHKSGENSVQIRKEITHLLVEITRHINAAARLLNVPEVQKCLEECSGIVEHYQLIVAEQNKKHKKKGEGDKKKPGGKKPDDKGGKKPEREEDPGEDKA